MDRTIVLRHFKPADAPALQRLRQSLWGADTETAAYYRFATVAPVVCTLVAERAGMIVGFGSLWASRMHPTSLYIGINVAPQHQRQGVGSMLYTALLKQRGRYAALPLQTAAWSSCTSALDFLRTRGFQEDKRTFLPQLELRHVAPSDYQHFAQSCSAAGYQLSSVADELAADADAWRAIAALAAAIYQDSHRSNPPAQLTAAEWADIAFDEIIEAGCCVVRRGAEYVGLSLLHQHSVPSTLAQGWIGVQAVDAAHVRQIVGALLYHELRYAKDYAYATIDLEVDTTDRHAMLLLELLPLAVDAAHAWVTLRCTS